MAKLRDILNEKNYSLNTELKGMIGDLISPDEVEDKFLIGIPALIQSKIEYQKIESDKSIPKDVKTRIDYLKDYILRAISEVGLNQSQIEKFWAGLVNPTEGLSIRQLKGGKTTTVGWCPKRLREHLITITANINGTNIGPGELYLAIVGKEGRLNTDEAGDIRIEGKLIEVKGGDGSINSDLTNYFNYLENLSMFFKNIKINEAAEIKIDRGFLSNKLTREDADKIIKIIPHFTFDDSNSKKGLLIKHNGKANQSKATQLLYDTEKKLVDEIFDKINSIVKPINQFRASDDKLKDFSVTDELSLALSRLNELIYFLSNRSATNTEELEEIDTASAFFMTDDLDHLKNEIGDSEYKKIIERLTKVLDVGNNAVDNIAEYQKRLKNPTPEFVDMIVAADSIVDKLYFQSRQLKNWEILYKIFKNKGMEKIIETVFAGAIESLIKKDVTINSVLSTDVPEDQSKLSSESLTVMKESFRNGVVDIDKLMNGLAEHSFNKYKTSSGGGSWEYLLFLNKDNFDDFHMFETSTELRNFLDTNNKAYAYLTKDKSRGTLSLKWK